jgi:alanyl-tRNA synthetase
MNSKEIREKYLKFFEKRGHKIIPSASLVPADYIIPDKGSLFTTAGMQPLIPYLLGTKHPAGTRLVDVQKCVRTVDIDDVGDNRHCTFFEMMGNWSLGDYFKKESIAWSLEFLTNKEEGLGLDPKRLYVTVFKGEDEIPGDEESIIIWKENFKKHNIDAEVAGEDEIIKDKIKIIPLGKDDNFWIAGQTGPCGGDTEFFYDIKNGEKLEGKFADLVKSGRIVEIWNNVFMEFNKTSEGKYEKLAKPNVDTGMGLERTTVMLQGKENVFETDLFESSMTYIKLNSLTYDEKSTRIIADHIRSSVFIISDGVLPTNTEAGYILRRILRRAIRHIDKVGLSRNAIFDLAKIVINNFSYAYPELSKKENEILEIIKAEDEKFRKTLEEGLKQLKHVAYKLENSEMIPAVDRKKIHGIEAFNLYQTYGFPIELTLEICKEWGIKVDVDGFNENMKKHQEISRAGSEQKFKGGLAGTGEMEIKYHTATHLLNAALRQILGDHVSQKGSNITSERLRFDFVHTEKLTDEQKKKVEDYVNGVIALRVPVTCAEMTVDEAKASGAQGVFTDKYDSLVKVYTVGPDNDHFSKEICGGPHVQNTGELGRFKIVKEEASSAGVRRIKAILE